MLLSWRIKKCKEMVQNFEQCDSKLEEGQGEKEMLKLWGQRCIWPQHRSVSILKTAWSNREWSQDKHFWTSVWHRKAELWPRWDHTAHSQYINPVYSAEHSISELPNLFGLWPLKVKQNFTSEPYITGCLCPLMFSLNSFQGIRKLIRRKIQN